MAQKINTNTFRVKTRLNWNVSFITHNFHDFFPVFTNNLIFSNVLQTIFQKLNIIHNNPLLINSSKFYKFFLNSFFEKSIHNMLNNKDAASSLIKRENLKTQTSMLSKLLMNSSLYSLEQSNIQSINKNNSKKGKFDFILKNQFHLFTPSIILSFVSKQIEKPNKLKNKLFIKNLQFGLFMLINNLLFINKHDIVGIKLMISGKWKKTRSGRKQKLVLNFGKIERSSVVNALFFEQNHQKTKYGSCNVRIWISHKIKK